MSAPSTLIEVLQKIEYEEALDATDARYVDTFAARGKAKTLSRLACKLYQSHNHLISIHLGPFSAA